VAPCGGSGSPSVTWSACALKAMYRSPCPTGSRPARGSTTGTGSPSSAMGGSAKEGGTENAAGSRGSKSGSSGSSTGTYWCRLAAKKALHGKQGVCCCSRGQIPDCNAVKRHRRAYVNQAARSDQGREPCSVSGYDPSLAACTRTKSPRERAGGPEQDPPQTLTSTQEAAGNNAALLQSSNAQPPEFRKSRPAAEVAFDGRRGGWALTWRGCPILGCAASSRATPARGAAGSRAAAAEEM
jgi:hypothetical protein